jgi:muconolactone delta-isomerase
LDSITARIRPVFAGCEKLNLVMADIASFVIRVGDWGGYMLLDCDDPTAVHKFCSMLPAFVFEARPVIPIEDAVRVELEAIAFRDGLKPR